MTKCRSSGSYCPCIPIDSDSAGTLGSSAILECSGIGAADHLKKIGIPQIVDLPGVGENYQSKHFVQLFLLNYTSTQEQLDMWTKDGTGLLRSNGVDAAIKLCPCEDELHELWPKFESRYRDFFANKPDKPIVWMKVSTRYVFNQLSQVAENRYTFLPMIQGYPAGHGSVHIVSDDVFTPLDFDNGVCYISFPHLIFDSQWEFFGLQTV
ncbi:hypothetical protein L208DRAFT_1517016 [Tricholoma matsutake]|nr:hypothetical protein L208DRAFT_1517016 [Tricholoma matsutake 945]